MWLVSELVYGEMYIWRARRSIWPRKCLVAATPSPLRKWESGWSQFSAAVRFKANTTVRLSEQTRKRDILYYNHHMQSINHILRTYIKVLELMCFFSVLLKFLVIFEFPTKVLSYKPTVVHKS